VRRLATWCEGAYHLRVSESADIAKSVVGDFARPASIDNDVVTGKVSMILDD